MTAHSAHPLPHPPHPQPPRLGPRPLPPHLALMGASWASSCGASTLLSSGLLPWKPEFSDAASKLNHALDGVAPEDFLAAVDRVGRARLGEFMTGVLAYRRHPRPPKPTEPPVIWQEGSLRLLDYGADMPTGAPSVLVVPSLINRAYVLDLLPDHSLMRWLAGSGIRPILVDWGSPGAEERRFTLTDYIAGPLEKAVEVVKEASGMRPGLIGYCMGGLLALALAQRRPDLVAHLALMATPWDFHADRRMADLAPLSALTLRLGIEAADGMPVDGLQMMFNAVDPWATSRKFIAFGRRAATTLATDPRMLAFVALEDWLNDGTDLVRSVARECMIGWYVENSPPNRQWRVAGRPVDPAAIKCPTLVIVPRQDRIVPPLSAMALAEAIKGSVQLTPAMGHIGMVTARAAPDKVWAPLANWCHAQSEGR